jgi:hypothetical protein
MPLYYFDSGTWWDMWDTWDTMPGRGLTNGPKRRSGKS